VSATSIIDNAKKATGKVICRDFGQSGSGFFIGDDGFFLTNNHVISKTIPSADGTLIIIYSKEIFVEIDKIIYPATIIIDENADEPAVYDYAILKVEGAHSAHISIGDFSQVKQGESVMAIGFSSGFDLPTASLGIVSAIFSRESHLNSLHMMNTFLMDAFVTYGNSGGPLIRLSDGTAVGIVTMPHEIRGKLREKLEKHLLSSSADVTQPIRDLIDYVFTYLHTGYNYAISIEYATNDSSYKTRVGIQKCL